MSSKKQQEEMELVRRFLVSLGHPHAQLECGDRPDLVAVIDGQRVGIEETKFHADERSGVPGSALRAAEAKIAKQANGKPYAMWGVTDPIPGVVARIKDKIVRAAKYDASRYSELWLVISSQLPMSGAMASTLVPPPLINVSRLNESTHDILKVSPFSAAHLHLATTHGLFSWSREKRWYATGDSNVRLIGFL